MDKFSYAVRLPSVLEIEVEIEREKRKDSRMTIARPEMIGIEYILHNLVYCKTHLTFSPSNFFFASLIVKNFSFYLERENALLHNVIKAVLFKKRSYIIDFRTV